MNEYTFEYWFRYSGDHKDFDIVTIKSETEEKAREVVSKLRKFIFKIELKTITDASNN